MCTTPEVYKIDSKPMRVDTMNKKGEVSSSEEYKCLLDICDEIGTKGDKKYVKREYKASLKKKYYWVQKEEDIFSTVWRLFTWKPAQGRQ